MLPRHFAAFIFLATLAAPAAASSACALTVAWYLADQIELTRPVVADEHFPLVFDTAKQLFQSTDLEAHDLFWALRALTLYMNDADLRPGELGILPPLPQRASPWIPQAAQLLGVLPPGIFDWRDRIVFKASIREVDRLMKDSRVAEEFADFAMRSLHAIAGRSDMHPLTKLAIQTAGRADGPMAIMMDEGTTLHHELGDAYALYFYALDSNAVDIAGGNGLPHEAVYPPQVPELGLPIATDYIIIPRPNDEGFVYSGFWAASITHEMLHWHDFRLVSAWIRANERKINRGKNPDELFRRFVRVDVVAGCTKMTLDRGFLNLFLESRAYFVTFDILDKLFAQNWPPGALDQYKPELLRGGIARLVHTDSGRPAMDMFAVTDAGEGFFEAGETIVATMLQSMKEEGVPTP